MNRFDAAPRSATGHLNDSETAANLRRPTDPRSGSQHDQWLSFLGHGGGSENQLVGKRDAPAEHEADAVAKDVMRSANAASLPPGSTPVTRCASRDGPADNSAPVVRDEVRSAPGALGAVLNEAGTPLSAIDRMFFEPRFGRPLGDVRVHTDRNAIEASRSINAEAFTSGSHIFFGAGREPGRNEITAHELAHVAQAASSGGNALPAIQRYPSAPRNSADVRIPADRSVVDVPAIPDIDLSPGAKGKLSATVTFNDPRIKHMTWELFDSNDKMVDGFSTTPGSATATSAPFERDDTELRARSISGRCLVRCIGLDAAHEPVSYADRMFWAWTTTPTGTAPDIVALEAKKKALGKVVAKGSGKSFSEVGKAFAELEDTNHDLGVLKTGTGTHVGTQCAVQPSGATPADCTNIVLQVLEATFAQQGKATDWAKIKKVMTANTKLAGRTDMSGVDLQAALQSEAGWKGVYWAPDPKYQVPEDELEGAKPNEASYTSAIATKNKTYYKNNPKKGYPGVTVDQKVTNYAPEKPNSGYGTASTTTKDTTQLDKLKKLTFGVLAAHGGFHMTLILNGKVLEVHWSLEATNTDLIQETDLESWAVGPKSGFHYYASGVIVGPPAEIDAAFK